MTAIVGVISDTHGLLRSEALDALRGSTHIIHGGDIGRRDLLDELAAIAPVTAVRGNNDQDRWCMRIPEVARLDLEGVSILALHDLNTLRVNLVEERVRIVISGHSHKPRIAERDGIILFNPGSAGPRRFSLPITVGRIVIENGAISTNLVELDVRSTPLV